MVKQEVLLFPAMKPQDEPPAPKGTYYIIPLSLATNLFWLCPEFILFLSDTAKYLYLKLDRSILLFMPHLITILFLFFRLKLSLFPPMYFYAIP